jgi:hypothetical protein
MPPPIPDASADPQDSPEELVVQFDRIDLAEIVRDSVAAASVASPSVLVEVNAPGTLPAVAEPEALRGAVRFLVDDACRRTDGGNLVTVKTGRVAEGVTVHVIDRGAGTDGGQPSLDLARSLVSIHGGILWSEPLPAGGTKVSFTIPEEPPALEGPQLEAASLAMRQLAESAAMAPAAVAVLEPKVEVDLLEEAQAEAARALELAVMADLASAEAPSGIEELTAAPSLPEVEEVIELEAPVVDIELQTLEAEALVEPEPEPEFEAAVEALVEPEPEAETEIEAVVEAAVEAAVEAEVEAPFEPPVEVVAEESALPPAPLEVAEEILEPEVLEEAPPPFAEVPMAQVESAPEPFAEPAAELPAEPVPEPTMPARPFIPDPLHPATQMLRGLALDFDPDADDVPRLYRG